MLRNGMRLALAILMAASIAAAQEDDPVSVLMKLRDRIVDQEQRIPNHTCVETVERALYQRISEQARQSCDTILGRRKQPNFARLMKVASTDRIRLEVAVGHDREIYSWPGASRFEDLEIDRIIPEGAMGTGQFATLLLSSFDARPQRFTFEGVPMVDGRSVYEYAFQIARGDSQYRYKDNVKPWTSTGYSGTLYVDPRTSCLVRLEIRTDELPPDGNTCEVDTALDYGTVALSGSEYWVPTATRQRFIGRDGAERENRYDYSSCRDFQAESSIAFGEHRPGAAPPASPAASKMELPAGLAVTIALTSTIRSDTSAAGDPIEGSLVEPVRDRQGAVLVPAGSGVRGRLMRVEVEHLPHPRVTFVLRWESLKIDGADRPVNLLPASKTDPELRVGRLAGIPAVLKNRGTAIELPRKDEEGYAAFHFSGEYRAENGLRSQWLTSLP